MPSQTTLRYSEQAYREGIPVGAVYHLCRGRGLPSPAASQLGEEAAAEAHRRALAHDDFNDYRHFCNWLTVTARNWARDQLRRRPLLLLDPDLCAQPVAAAEDHEALNRLPDLLARLPPADREILQLVYLEQLTLDEVASVLEPDGKGSANARRLRIMRRRNLALTRLRAYYKE